MDRSSQIQELTTAQLITEQQRGTLILDTRPAEQFAALHIRGSIQISLLGHFAAWAAMLLDPASQLVLISEDEKHAREAHGMQSVPPEVAEKVKSKIRDQ